MYLKISNLNPLNTIVLEHLFGLVKPLIANIMIHMVLCENMWYYPWFLPYFPTLCFKFNFLYFLYFLLYYTVNESISPIIVILQLWNTVTQECIRVYYSKPLTPAPLQRRNLLCSFCEISSRLDADPMTTIWAENLMSHPHPHPHPPLSLSSYPIPWPAGSIRPISKASAHRL